MVQAVWPGSSQLLAVWPGSSQLLAVWPGSSQLLGLCGQGLVVSILHVLYRMEMK